MSIAHLNNHQIGTRLGIEFYYEGSVKPLIQDGISLVFQGHLFRDKSVADDISDEQFIIEMYKKYGMEFTLSQLEGSFILILYDSNLSELNSFLYVARDPFGVIPLFELRAKKTSVSSHYSNSRQIFMFSDRAETISIPTHQPSFEYSIAPFPAGTFTPFKQKFKVCPKWKQANNEHIRYSELPSIRTLLYFREFLKSLEGMWMTGTLESHRIFHEVINKRCRLFSLEEVACYVSDTIVGIAIIDAVAEFYHVDSSQIHVVNDWEESFPAIFSDIGFYNITNEEDLTDTLFYYRNSHWNLHPRGQYPFLDKQWIV
jgi:hypothetical protein